MDILKDNDTENKNISDLLNILNLSDENLDDIAFNNDVEEKKKILNKKSSKKERKRKSVEKAGKTTGVIYNRVSTLLYEMSKTLAPEIIITDPFLIEERGKLLDLLPGKCSYCRKNDANSKKGDHFYPLVAKSRPSNYGNDIFNVIPCCAPCNSNKSGKNWKVWMMNVNTSKHPFKNLSEEERKKSIEKFELYDCFINKHCQRRENAENDLIFYDEQAEIVKKFLADIQLRFNNYISRRNSALPHIL